MKKLNLALLLIAAGPFMVHSLSAVVKVEVRAAIGVATCTGANATCPVEASVNAPAFECCGDPAGQEVTDLGTITAETKKDLAVPRNPNEKRLYSFTPSEGDFANKKIFVGFKYNKGRPGTRGAGKHLIFVFRHVGGTPIKGDWPRVGVLTSDEQYPAEVSFTFKADGDVTLTENPNIVFDVGQENLAE